MALNELGYKLKMKLLENRKTQSWLCEQYGISKQLLSNCINGESNLKLEEAIRDYIRTGAITYVKNRD